MSAVGFATRVLTSARSHRNEDRVFGNRVYSEPLLNRPAQEPEIISVPTADGVTLHVQAYGPADGDIVVLAHGWTCSLEFWYPQINVLAQRCRVIAYDQRGHGRSTRGTAKPATDQLADDLAAVMQAVVPARRKAVVVGHSMGGMTIMAWAARHPDQVRTKARAVMLANTGAHDLVAEQVFIPRFQARKYPKAVGRVVLGAPFPYLPVLPIRSLVKYIASAPHATSEQIDFTTRVVFGCNPFVRAAWGSMLATMDIEKAAANLTVPTVVLAGSADKMTPVVHSQAIAEALDAKGALERFTVIEGAGHMANIDSTSEFNAELERLIYGKRRRRTA